ncbi:Nitrilase protein [Dioscorea alata]|uniref:Nitrilase protein n=1 Tax=Dioscorea alata TaxID=55571 RepID=A0ACB7V374_DIOAL|nr:Nitrilase protein [Dioscorea alata]
MAASSIRVGAVQMTSTNDIEANFNTCSRLVKEASIAGVKLLCFPEAFSFELPRCDFLFYFRFYYFRFADFDPLTLIASVGFKEKGPDDKHLYNSHVLVDDTGNIKSLYRKIHLLYRNMVYEESNFTTPGHDIVVVDSPVGRLGLTVCYDLRFPKLYQPLWLQHDAQVLFVPVAFTRVTGEAHWEILLRARAIETQCYVVAAAQAGKYNEKRESYDRLSTGIAIVDIDLSNIASVRTRMPISEIKGSPCEKQRSN